MNFKFGVLYCKEGQTSDEEMYNNGKNIFTSEVDSSQLDDFYV